MVALVRIVWKMDCPPSFFDFAAKRWHASSLKMAFSRICNYEAEISKLYCLGLPPSISVVFFCLSCASVSIVTQSSDVHNYSMAILQKYGTNAHHTSTWRGSDPFN